MKDFDTLCKQIKTEHGKAKYQTAEQEVFPRVCQLDQVVANTEAELRKVTDVFRTMLRPLLKKLPLKRRFNLGVKDQMFDHYRKL